MDWARFLCAYEKKCRNGSTYHFCCICGKCYHRNINKKQYLCTVKMNSKQILCEHVNRLLQERNITKRELAEGIDMDKSNLGKMLNGQHPFDVKLLDPIAEYFGVDCEELIGHSKMTVKKKQDTTVLIVQTQKLITAKIIEQILEIL